MNCEESFESTFKYCPHCGQEAADKLTVGVLFSNTISNYFSVDARFLKSFLPLMLKPGVIARRFVDGRRRQYLHPAQYYLFVSVIFFFIFSFTVRKADSNVSGFLERNFQQLASDSFAGSSTDSARNTLLSSRAQALDSVLERAGNEEAREELGLVRVTIEEADSVQQSRRDVLDSLIAHGASENEKLKAMGLSDEAGGFTRKVYVQALKVYERNGDGIVQTVFDAVPIAMFILLPLFALILMLFFRMRGTYAHHVVFSFYYFTFLFTTFSLLALVNMFIAIPMVLNNLVFLSCIVYLSMAMRHFYGSRWLASFFKAGLVSLVYMVIVIPIAMIGIIMFSFLMY